MTCRAAFLLVALTALAADPAGAQETGQLEAIEQSIEEGEAQAGALGQQAASLSRQMIAIRTELVARAKAAQNLETRIAHLEDALAEMEASEAEMAHRLAGQRASLARTLAGLQRIALQPPEAVLLEPAAPVAIVRGSMLLGMAVPAIEARARALREELDQLRLLREDIIAQRTELGEAGQALAGEQERLAALMAGKVDLLQSAETAQQATLDRVGALAAQARDLQELLVKLASPPPPPLPQLAIIPPKTPERPQGSAPLPEPATLGSRLDQPAELRPFPANPASLTLPARGRLVGRFGSGAEIYAKGILIEARPGAQVVAPFDGQIVFRGPFRGYGEILIIEHRGGYHSLLAGLGRCDVAVGQWLLAGEPVGVMDPAAGGSPRLYVELRRGGQPIDPLPWLAVRDSKLE